MKRESSGDSNVTLKIPRPLYEQLKQVIEGSGFHSVTEFAVYVLRDLVSHHGRGTAEAVVTSPAPTAPESDVQALTPAEIEAIRKRLESLGYL